MKSVRPAIYSDLPKLARIKLLARGESDNPDSSAFCAELRYLTAFLDDRQSVFVLLIDKVPAAFCAVRESSAKPFAGYAHIKDLYVLPGRQGRGLGKRLLSHTLRELRARGYIRAVLECAENNEGARRFYEKSEFVRADGGLSGYVTYVIDL